MSTISVDSALIRALSDGQFHSGESLGKDLGISRAAVWKRVKKLAEFGLQVDSVRGKGYRLSRPLELLCEQQILHLAGSALPVMDIRILPATASTNADALSAAADGLQRPLAILAEYQWSGRGRRGRRWHSPFGTNLYLSVAWHLPVGASRLEGLSLVVGVIVAEVLEKLGYLGLSLKWPNDLFIDQQKLGGILVELAGDLDDACVAVIGIGINVAMSGVEQNAIDQPWTSLSLQSGSSGHVRNKLAAELLCALQLGVEVFLNHGFPDFHDRWGRLDACAGKPVNVLLAGGKQVTGMARGVNRKGALLVDVGGVVETFHGGEVSLRLQ